jgi:hypothetical protein
MVRHSESGRQPDNGEEKERRAAYSIGVVVLPQADGPTRKDVRVKEVWRKRALWRLVRVIFRKFQGDLKKS